MFGMSIQWPTRFGVNWRTASPSPAWTHRPPGSRVVVVQQLAGLSQPNHMKLQEKSLDGRTVLVVCVPLSLAESFF